MFQPLKWQVQVIFKRHQTAFCSRYCSFLFVMVVKNCNPIRLSIVMIEVERLFGIYVLPFFFIC
jgi:hypothetical protein